MRPYMPVLPSKRPPIPRDRWFESAFLQQRVACEPEFLDQNAEFAREPDLIVGSAARQLHPICGTPGRRGGARLHAKSELLSAHALNGLPQIVPRPAASSYKRGASREG